MNAEQIHDKLVKAYRQALNQTDIRQDGVPESVLCDLGLDAQQEQAFVDFFNQYVRKAALDAAKLHADATLVAISEFLAAHPTSM